MQKLTDVIWNVLLPLLLGTGLYLLKVAPLLRNHLADGMWAYAFTSALLIIWGRQINLVWIGMAFMAFIGFEYGQAIKILPGTGDVKDVLTYAVFGLLALLTNRLYKPKKIIYEN